MSQINTRLPVKREPTPPPALWQQAAPAVIRATALIAAGVIGQWALRRAATKAVSVPFSRNGKKSKAVVREKGDGDIVAISETVVMRRRVIVRR